MAQWRLLPFGGKGRGAVAEEDAWNCYRALDSLVGPIDVEDMLDEIFSKILYREMRSVSRETSLTSSLSVAAMPGRCRGGGCRAMGVRTALVTLSREAIWGDVLQPGHRRPWAKGILSVRSMRLMADGPRGGQPAGIQFRLLNRRKGLRCRGRARRQIVRFTAQLMQAEIAVRLQHG
jgi:hypothetical protein